MNHSTFHTFLRQLAALLLCIMLFCSLTACHKNDIPISKSGLYFDTIITVTLYDTHDTSLLEHCFTIADSYDRLFSNTIEESDIYRINHSNQTPVSVSPETIFLLQTALFYSEMTEGRLDVSIGPLSDLWDFSHKILSTSEQIPPSDTEIAHALSHVNYRNIHIDEESATVTLTDSEAGLDLGFIAKGYIADKIKEYLVSAHVQSAIINLGGNVLTIGAKPDHSAFSIGIQKPFADMNTPITTISVIDQSVVSSGIYERYFEYEDTLYHHILDGTTGYPIQNDLLSVTIISDSSMTGDVLSTTCFILGLEQGSRLIQSMEHIEAIFITKNMEIHRITQ